MVLPRDDEEHPMSKLTIDTSAIDIHDPMLAQYQQHVRTAAEHMRDEMDKLHKGQITAMLIGNGLDPNKYVNNPDGGRQALEDDGYKIEISHHRLEKGSKYTISLSKIVDLDSYYINDPGIKLN